MIAFKGFNEKLQCTKGNGKFQYKIGETYTENESKCRRTGFHCTENPIDCIKWYPLDGQNRHVLIEAAGDIDEVKENSDFACTKITLVKELNAAELTMYTMKYMILHPKREYDDQPGNVLIGEKVAASDPGQIVIARGINPMVKGVCGTTVGLIREDQNGIVDAKILIIGRNAKEKTWYGLSESGLMEE